MNVKADRISYLVPMNLKDADGRLVLTGGREEGRDFPFIGQIEIGRYKGGDPKAGFLLIENKMVSSSHCVIYRDRKGGFFILDRSRNGTRVDGRRLSPNVQTEIQVGQVISVGPTHQFRLEAIGPGNLSLGGATTTETIAAEAFSVVTVLVGDLTNYTAMVQDADPNQLRASMSRLFTALEGAVVDLGGTVKEFQGDAIFAFWEQQSDRAFTAKACLAAIKLNDMVEKMAVDPSIWSVEGFPLTMDWAIATGVVAMAAHGAGHALGLSMVGEPVVLAYRIEKFACAETGPIVTCQKTRDAVHSQFRFSELGRHSVKGLSGEKEIYALLGEDIGPRGSP